MEKEYIFLLAEEGYIEVEQRKNGEDNTDNRIHQSGGSSLNDYPAAFLYALLDSYINRGLRQRPPRFFRGSLLSRSERGFR